MLIRTLYAFFLRDAKIAISYRFAFFFDLFAVFFSAATFYFVAKLFGSAKIQALAPYGGDYFAFVIIGLALSTYQTVGLTSFSQSIRQEQFLGTLESVLVSPISIPRFLISSALWDFMYATLEVFLYLGFGVFIFGLAFPVVRIVPAICFLILTVFAFMSFGILSAAFIILFKRGNPVTWMFVTISELMGGVYFPLEVLPPWMKKLSLFIPMTHALEGLRGAILSGKSLNELKFHAFSLMAFAVLFLPIGIFFFHQALKRARHDGSLGHY